MRLTYLITAATLSIGYVAYKMLHWKGKARKPNIFRIEPPPSETTTVTSFWDSVSVHSLDYELKRLHKEFASGAITYKDYEERKKVIISKFN